MKKTSIPGIYADLEEFKYNWVTTLVNLSKPSTSYSSCTGCCINHNSNILDGGYTGKQEKDLNEE